MTVAKAAGRGVEVGRKIVGSKRSIVMDTTSLSLTVPVTAARVQDFTAGAGPC
ncbi:hypothetical protein JHN63_43230 [Streptomyces sp. MBT65]|uniref:hypothetical protein n=1 Tax=Streptomyces sp. MBT65 TaxID=1488395 RepID=UPI00190992E7|nr:hypothetical protein [Streptomyces sp. MBT65]MBK3580486.1 hypothetical protein [Streptomyces sp. MBT65]